MKKSTELTRYFNLARNVSKYSNCRVRVGAVIVAKRPIGVGYNILKTHPIHANPNNSIRSSIHAEIKAIMNCSDSDLHGACIYIYRETKEGLPAIARPCNYCFMNIKKVGIKKIFYTISEKPYWRMEVI